MGKKYAAFLLVVLLLAVPQADLLACASCSANPENARMLEAVSHLEDECQLQDGFERDAGSSQQQDPIHIHFCVLHSTFLALSPGLAIQQPEIGESVSAPRSGSEDPPTATFYHPPQLG